MRKRMIYLICTIIGMLGLCSCGGADKEESAAYQQITQEEAKTIMDEQSDIIILDVRTQEEHDLGYIPGSICIPNEDIDASVSEQLPDKDQTILVYCRSGNRSKQAAQKLADLGYTDVREFGGINDWKYKTTR